MAPVRGFPKLMHGEPTLRLGLLIGCSTEVQILLGGVNSPIDIDDLKRYTHYGGVYDESHAAILLFWKVVEKFDQEQKRALLRFVTSCSRPPLLWVVLIFVVLLSIFDGLFTDSRFRELVPDFAIRYAGPDEDRLPTSSTCVNLLKVRDGVRLYILGPYLTRAAASLQDGKSDAVQAFTSNHLGGRV